SAIRTTSKSGIECAVGIEPTEMVAHSRASTATAESGKVASDENFSVGLDGQRIDFAVRAGIKGSVKRAIGIHACEPVARHGAGTAASEERRVSNECDLAVRLPCYRAQALIRAGIEVRAAWPVGVRSTYEC